MSTPLSHPIHYRGPSTLIGCLIQSLTFYFRSDFEFFPANHSVIRGTYENPCLPYDMMTAPKDYDSQGDVYSQFQPVSVVRDSVRYIRRTWWRKPYPFAIYSIFLWCELFSRAYSPSCTNFLLLYAGFLSLSNSGVHDGACCPSLLCESGENFSPFWFARILSLTNANHCFFVVEHAMV